MTSENYCPKCNQPFEQGTNICIHCGYKPKSKVVAGILQIFLPLGIGRFYLGDIKIGVLQLLANFVCGIGVIWCIIDGIMILVGHAKTTESGANAINTITKIVNDPGVRKAASDLKNSVKDFGNTFDIEP